MEETAQERILKKIKVENGCWIWQGTVTNGYGMIYYKGKRWRAHRFSYTAFVGDIPEGKVLDHVLNRGCQSTACVNPDHLEPVTQAENMRRGRHPNMILHREGKCKKGHKVEGDNVTLRPDGRKKCKECHKLGERRRRMNKALAKTYQNENEEGKDV